MIDVELYGGRRGFLEHVRVRVLYALGTYGNRRDIEWAAVRRLAFVCKGNICRSPYACARTRSFGVPAVSFGLSAVDGTPADPIASRNALLRGIDLSGHLSVKIESGCLVDGDLIVVFEPGQLADLQRRFGEQIPMSLLGVWSCPSRPHVHDPYGGSDRYFQECFSVIDENIAKLVEHMVAHGAPAASDLAATPSSESAGHRKPCDRTLI